MAKKRQLTEAQRIEEINKLKKALEDFYYNDEGLGCTDAPHTSKQEPDRMALRFYNEEGQSIGDSYELFDELEEGKPIVAYKFGEENPIKINYENGKLSLGKNLNELGQEPKAPGFLNRFLSFFGNKKAKEICNTYDQYIADNELSKKFNEDSIKNTRKLNIDTEKKYKRFANAEKNHEAQKSDIHRQISSAGKENSIEGFESTNRWERTSFDHFCMEVGKLYKMSDPDTTAAKSDDLQNDIFESFDEKRQILELGQNLVQNTVSNNYADIFEALVGKIVTGKTTDLEEKKLDDYFKLGHVDYAYRKDPMYKGADFTKVADPSAPVGVHTFNEMAKEMFEAKDKYTNFELNDTKAMLALASHQFNALNTKVQAKENPLGKIGSELLDYQRVYNRIANTDSQSLKFDTGELMTIAHIHLIKQSLKKQIAPGENDVQHLFSEEVFNKSYDTNLRNKAIKKGIDVIDDSIKSSYFKDVLGENGIKPYELVNRNDIAKFINDEANYKLVFNSVLEGLNKESNNYQIKLDQPTNSNVKENVVNNTNTEVKNDYVPGF